MQDSHSNHKAAGGEARRLPFQFGSELLLKSLENAALKTKAILYGVVPGQMLILEEPVFNLNERLSGLSEGFTCGYIRGNYMYSFESRFIRNLLPNVIGAEYPREVKRIQIRASTRIPVNIEGEVVLGTKFGTVSGIVKDISEGGCRVQLPGPVLMAKGSKFRLSFVLPDGEDVDDILCRVMNFRHYPDAKATAFGVSFRGPERSIPKIQKFCRSVLCSPFRIALDDFGSPQQPDVESLSKFRNAFLNILDSLALGITGEYENRFSDLLKKVEGSESLLTLGPHGEQIGQLVGELMDRAVERADYSNGFLVELSKDLYKMEGQLSSYQNFSRETHQMNSEFHDDLLSQTDAMHNAVDPSKNAPDVRNLITSKLNTIRKAIEDQRLTESAREQESNTKIAELQKDLRTYEQEILRVREISESLEKKTLLDELTQINNRRAYDIEIRESLRRYRRNGELFALVLIDIDHFKTINDTYGHKAGDKCLKEMAQLIKSSLRQSDFVARYGGEELVIILRGSNAAVASNVAEKVRHRIETTSFCYHGARIPLTISLGVTEALASDTDPETPFLRVDEAMYLAKRDGRNRVCANVDPSLCKIAG